MARPSIRETIKNLEARGRAEQKARAFVQHFSGPHSFVRDGYRFTVREWRYLAGEELLETIVEATPLRGGLASLAVANPLRFKNPPIMVPDGTTRTELVDGGFRQVDNFKEDLQEAAEAFVAEAAFTSDQLVRAAARRKGVTLEEALTGDPTLTAYADAGDGSVGCSNATYSTARSGAGTLLMDSSSSSVNRCIGQRLNAGTYQCLESFFSFDTSSLGSGASISAAVFSLYGAADNSTTDFTLEARLRDWGGTVETSDFVAGASLSADTLLATFATSGGWNTAGYNDFTDVALPANVSKTGNTRLYVSSDRHRTNTAPTGDESVGSFFGDNAGTTNDPKLVVTYTSVSTVSKTVAVDAIKRATGTRTVAVDAILRASTSKTVGVDAILKATKTKTVGVDAILKATATKQYGVDAVVQRVVTKPYSIDAVLKGTLTKLHSVDAILRATKTVQASVDALVVRPTTKSYSLDAVLRATGSRGTSVDAVLRATSTKSFGIDAALKRIAERTYGLDALLYKPTGLIHTFTAPDGSSRTLPIVSGTREFVDGFTGKAKANGGYTDAVARISREEYDAHPDIYVFGTTWRVRDADDGDRVRWAGRMTSPAFPADGSVTLQAKGRGNKADKTVRHFFWQSRDTEEWAPGDTDPFDYAVSELIEAKATGKKLRFKVARNTAFVQPNGKAHLLEDESAGNTTVTLDHNHGGLLAGATITIDGESKTVHSSYNEDSTYVKLTSPLSSDHPKGSLVSWNVSGGYTQWKSTLVCNIEGVPLTRIAFKWKASHKDDYVLELCKADGPDGNLTVFHTINIANDGNGRVDEDITGGKDLVAIRVRRTAKGAKVDGWWLDITEIRLNGLADGDDYSTSDMLIDVAGKVGGTTTGIQTSPRNGLPLAFFDTKASDVADSIRIIDDWPWGIYDDGTQAEWISRPWGYRTWELVEPRFPVNLTQVDRYTEVIVPCRTKDGVRRTKRYAVPDISGIHNELLIPFEDPLPSVETADVVGPIIAANVAEEQFFGDATFTTMEDVDDPGVSVPGGRIKPGDKLKVTYNGNHTLRVQEVEWTEAYTRAIFPSENTFVEQMTAMRRLLLARGRGANGATIRSLGLGRPKVPVHATPAVTYKRREKKNHKNDFDAIFDWLAVTEDIRDNITEIKRYVAQMQYVDALGNPIAGLEIVEKPVEAKDEKDAGDDPKIPTRAVFSDLKRPRLWYQRFRVYAVDILGKQSNKSNWTTPTGVGAEHDPPALTSISIDVDAHVVRGAWDCPRDDEDPKEPDQRIDKFFYKLKRPNGTTAREGTTKDFQKVWDLGKVASGTWTLEVGTMDSNQRKSAVAIATGDKHKPPTPAAPSSITFKRGGKKGLRGVVNGTLGAGTAYIDNDYDKIIIQHQAEDSNPGSGDDIIETIVRIDPTDASQPYAIVVHDKLKAGEKFRARVIVEDKQKNRSDPSAWTSIVTVTAPKKPNKVSGRSIVPKTRALKCKWTPPTTWSDGSSVGFSPSEIAYNEVTLRRAGADVETIRVGGGATDFAIFPMTKAEAALTGYSFSVTPYGWDEEFTTADAATGSATPEGIIAEGIDDGAITYPKFDTSVGGIVFTSSTTTSRTLDGRVTQTLNTPPSGTFKAGDVCYNSSDKKLYRFDGTWWRRAADGGDFTAGSIVADDITAGTFNGLTFTGGTFRTAGVGNNRIEMSAAFLTDIIWYSSANVQKALVGTTPGGSDLNVDAVGEIVIGSSASQIRMEENTKFGGNIGFFGTTPISKRTDPGNHSVTTGVDNDGNARAKINDILAVLRAYGLL